MRRTLAPLLVIAAAALVGLLVAGLVNRELRVTFETQPVAAEPQIEARAAEPLAPIAAFDAILVPVDAPLAGFYRVAASQLADALALRTGRRPAVRAEAASSPAARSVTVQLTHDAEPGDGFHIRASGTTITIAAASPLAAAHGLAFLAEQLLAGIDDATLRTIDRVVVPALAERFVDLGGVGVPVDTAAWRTRDYSHHNRAFTHVVLADAPYIDAAALDDARRQFRAYVDRMAAYGYNGIIFKGFLEFVDFDLVGDGTDVYAADSPYRARQRALRAAFGELFAYAHAIGMKVVLSTDMIALTPPLARYLERRFGSIDAENAALWDVYRVALDELFATMPAIDGVMIRVGETGGIFNLAGWDYYSELQVRTVPALHAMLSSLAAAAHAHDRRIYFRTWSVGVGETGGMHTRPDTYARIFDALDEPGLVVSTKFVAGDFYSFLPLNPTLATGDEPRLIEFQARREYEGFASFPNYMAPLHQAALRELRAANPHITGMWVWTQEGGPVRASPMSVYPFHGFWQLIDADVWVAARLGWDPDADVATLTRAWLRRTVGGDERVIDELARVLLDSRAAVLDGLYLSPFAARQVHALGLEPPPMLWIFEWDIVTGSSAALSTIYTQTRGRLDETIALGFAAAARAGALRERAAALDRARVGDATLLDTLQRALAYEEDLLRTLALYRQTFLRHYEWLETGRAATRQAWRDARDAFDTQLAAHTGQYGDDLDFRAYSFHDAEIGLAHAARSVAMLRLARALLVLIALTVVLGALRPALRASPHFVIAWPLTLIAAAGLVCTSFLSIGALVLNAVLVGGFVLALTLQTRGDEATHHAGPMAALLWLAAIPLAAVAVRGPGWFWFMFWTSAPFRTLLLTLSVVAAGVLALATMAALRRARGFGTRAAVGGAIVAFGTPLVVLGALLGAVGLERALTLLNGELAILPMGLSVILGITTHLNIPGTLPIAILMAGAALVGAGTVLHANGARPGRDRAAPPGAPAVSSSRSGAVVGG